MLLVEDSRYVQLEPSAFRGLYSDDYVAFRRGSGEDIAFAFRNTDAYERLSWYETYTGQRRFMIGVTIVLGIAALGVATVVVATILLISEIHGVADVVTVLLLGVSLAVAAVITALTGLLGLVASQIWRTRDEARLDQKHVVALERERLALEKERLALEKERLEVERQRQGLRDR